MSIRNSSTERTALAIMQGVIGLIWCWSGIEKLFSDRGFDGGSKFAQHMAGTLGFFASKNPHAWYQELLRGVAIPHATTFGYMVAVGETVTGTALVVTAALILAGNRTSLARWAPLAAMGALLVAITMNSNYWLASAWISIADDRINLLMAALELVLVGASVAMLATDGQLAPLSRLVTGGRGVARRRAEDTAAVHV